MKALKLSTALALIAGAASAQDTGLSAGFSIFGPVVEGTFKISENIEARAFAIGGLNLKRSTNLKVSGFNYNIKGTARLGGFGVLADYYPTSIGWRVSGGVFMSANAINADFVGPQNFKGDVKLSNSIAPMVTTGYRHTFGGNWTIAADVGAIFSGVSASSDSTLPQVQAEVDKINAKLKQIDVLPYASITFGYRF